MRASIQTIREDTPYLLNHYWAIGSASRPWQQKAMCKLTRVKIDSHYACYLPLGEDQLSMDEVKEMLLSDPTLFGHADQ
jgi:hypothetical protein